MFGGAGMYSRTLISRKRSSVGHWLVEFICQAQQKPCRSGWLLGRSLASGLTPLDPEAGLPSLSWMICQVVSQRLGKGRKFPRDIRDLGYIPRNISVDMT